MNDATLFGTDLFGESLAPKPKSITSKRFLLPPFSVLSAREGEWQDRKRAWISLGIQSEVGRLSGITWGESDQMNDPQLNYYRNANKKVNPRLVTDYVKGEIDLSKVTQTIKGTMGAISAGTSPEIAARFAQAGTGTSIFDPVLCEICYRWFCPKGGQIIDPFSGGSVRGIVASCLGFNYWGCDLRQEQIDANEQQGRIICPDEFSSGKLLWAQGDSAEMLEWASSADFIFSCPPYGDLEVYSDHPADLSNMTWPAFVESYRKIIGLAVATLKPNRFACFVVGDFRDEQGFYRNFVSTTIAAFDAAGCKLYNEGILLTAVGSLPIRITKQFNSGRKFGKTHQNVLVFYKGDPKRIKEEFGPCFEDL